MDPTDGHQRRWRAASERDGKRLMLGMWADVSTRHVCYRYLGGNASGLPKSGKLLSPEDDYSDGFSVMMAKVTPSICEPGLYFSFLGWLY